MIFKNNPGVSRREILAALLALPVSVSVMAGRLNALAVGQELEPTPACGDREDGTPPQTAGPFFKPRSPERKSLVDAGIQGTRIILEGQVRTTKCRPVRRALLDFWQADASGAYDNAGYKLRGHQFTDARGRYRLETIIPGRYPGRTRHLHVRAQAPNRRVLTTQLYFPGEPENQRDGIFNPNLVISLRDAADGQLASFDFVLA